MELAQLVLVQLSST